MPHALKIFSDAYKQIDPVFSKRSRQLLRSLERCKIAAQKAAAAGEPETALFTAFREFLADHSAFSAAFKTRSQHHYFPNAQDMILDLDQLGRLYTNITLALPGDNKAAMVSVVQELMQC